MEEEVGECSRKQQRPGKRPEKEAEKGAGGSGKAESPNPTSAEELSHALREELSMKLEPLERLSREPEGGNEQSSKDLCSYLLREIIPALEWAAETALTAEDPTAHPLEWAFGPIGELFCHLCLAKIFLKDFLEEGQEGLETLISSLLDAEINTPTSGIFGE